MKQIIIEDDETGTKYLITEFSDGLLEVERKQQDDELWTRIRGRVWVNNKEIQ